MSHAGGWRIERLIELLEHASGGVDVAAVAQPALEHALTIVGARAGTMGWAGSVVATAGLERCPAEVARSIVGSVVASAAEGVGGWHVQRERMYADGGWLALAFDDADGEGVGELATLTAGVLGSALGAVALRGQRRMLRERGGHLERENERLREALSVRQALLERLSRIQRAIVQHVPLQAVLDIVLADTAQLLGAEVAYVLLIDRGDPERLLIAAGRGLPCARWAQPPPLPVTCGLAGRALGAAAFVESADYSMEPWAWEPIRGRGLHAAMATPLWENGRVAGVLFVARRSEERAFGRAERDTLLAFAEHASLALSDARNLDSAVHRGYHDLLTGLPNRALLLERLEHAQHRAERSGASTAVLLVDLDGFKRVNDSLGHAAGDQLLIEVAGRLEDCLRPADTAARLGGDEFAILLEGLERETDATIVASRVLLALQEPVELAGRRMTISASIGVALHRSDQDDLLRDADLAMYRAKGAGRNRFEVFDAVLHTVAMDSMRLESQLQRAVENGELVLHFQPIVGLATAGVEGVEALVRWDHPERGLLGPAAFIPAAEQTRVISALGRWVLNEACREALGWQCAGESGTPIAVSVNLSVSQLREPGLIYVVAEALERSGLEPASLILEVTETMLTDDVEQMAGTLTDLKRLGVQLAVDDFGTGYSSLQYLRLFPIDILKIAKPFVDGMDGGDNRLARVILDLGRSLELRVIAEGIERASQARALRRLGCRWGQGFHYSRPLPAEEIRTLLATAANPHRTYGLVPGAASISASAGGKLAAVGGG